VLTLHLDGKTSTDPQWVQITLAILSNKMTGPFKLRKLKTPAEHWSC